MGKTNYQQSADRYALRPNGGTDSLAFRAVSARIKSLNVTGTALDIGCGSGRSTRLLTSHGLRATGVDVSDAMIGEAQRIDPTGDYRLIERG